MEAHEELINVRRQPSRPTHKSTQHYYMPLALILTQTLCQSGLKLKALSFREFDQTGSPGVESV